METGIIKYLNEKFELNIPVETTQEQMEIFLAGRINQIIENDFTQLLQILYRIDVSEQKLRSLLKQNTGTDAGRIIAVLIIERQLEKSRSRQVFRKDDKDINEEERWN